MESKRASDGAATAPGTLNCGGLVSPFCSFVTSLTDPYTRLPSTRRWTFTMGICLSEFLLDKNVKVNYTPEHTTWNTIFNIQKQKFFKLINITFVDKN